MSGGWAGRRRCVGRALALLTVALSPALAGGQAAPVHGENSVFAGHGVVIAWGVLKQPVEDESQVAIRIVVTGQTYTYIGIDAVDPLSKARRPVLSPEPVVASLEVRSPRGGFADLPSREVHLYRTADEARAARPALTVYYLGIPDTTPEFTSDAALRGYLETAIATARGKTP